MNAGGPAPALHIQNLSFSYHRQQKVLHNVSVRVHTGDRVALVGPNGAGKSTLFNLIMGLERIQQGSIAVCGVPIEKKQHLVAVVPQRSVVDWRFPVTVLQVVMMGRYTPLRVNRNSTADGVRGAQPTSAQGMRNISRAKRSAQDKDASLRALHTMKIEHLAHERIGELSGGQQQRVMLARALAQDAPLLLLDEPLNHIDFPTQEIIFHTIEELCARGKTVMISTHDIGILTVHFNRALFLDKTIVADGPVSTVLTAENIARAYGFEFHQNYRSPLDNNTNNRHLSHKADDGAGDKHID